MDFQWSILLSPSLALVLIKSLLGPSLVLLFSPDFDLI